MGRLVLRARERAALADASRVLLSPMDFDDVDDWRRAVNRAVGELLGADQRSFVLPCQGRATLLTDDFEPAAVRAYEAAFERVDHRYDLLKRASGARVTTRRTTWGPHIADFYRSAYYNDVLAPIRAFDNLSAVVHVGEALPAQLMFNHASPRGRRFGRRGQALLELLVPSLLAGAQAVTALAGQARDLGRLIDRLPGALVLVGPRGILHRNRAAARIMERPGFDSLRRKVERVGRRTAPQARAHTELTADLEGPADEIHMAGARIRLHGTRVAGTVGVGRALTLVTIEHQATGLGATERLGLTPREAEVAGLLARRLTSREIADRLSISPHTVRRHTERVLAKLGVRSRRDVEDVLGCPDPHST